MTAKQPSFKHTCKHCMYMDTIRFKSTKNPVVDVYACKHVVVADSAIIFRYGDGSDDVDVYTNLQINTYRRTGETKHPRIKHTVKYLDQII